MINWIGAEFSLVCFDFHDDWGVDLDEQMWILASIIPSGQFCTP